MTTVPEPTLDAPAAQVFADWPSISLTRLTDPFDNADIVDAVDLLNAARLVDAPEEVPSTNASYAASLRHGWDGDAPQAWLMRESGTAVGTLELILSTYDNYHLAWGELVIHPEHRRRGHGSRLLRAALDLVVAQGRRTLVLFWWDSSAGHRFAEAREFTPAQTEIIRRQYLDKLDWAEIARIRTQALAVASDYRLLRIAGPAPAELLGAITEMTAAINDAPTDDLDWEDEVYTPARMRAFEAAQLGRDRRLYRVIAQHRDGTLAGVTEIVVEAERPWLGSQLGTSVVRAHRGHRLGLALKADMLQWLREAAPQLRQFDTGNAATNPHMIAVNEQLGYEVIGPVVSWQRRLG